MAILNAASAAKTGMLNGVNTALGNGATLTLYSGTMPANGDTALSGNTALATFTFGSPFGTVSGATLTASGLPMTTAVIGAGGVASFGRYFNSSGVAIADGDVGTSGTTIIVGNTTLQTGTNAQLTSATFTAS